LKTHSLLSRFDPNLIGDIILRNLAIFVEGREIKKFIILILKILFSAIGGV
jgi:hypothetical protein